MLRATQGFRHASRISAAQRIPVQGDPNLLENQLHEQAARLKQLPGFLSYRILRPIAPEDPFTILTFWQTRQHYERYYRPDLFYH